jgi:hypothetical protein
LCSSLNKQILLFYGNAVGDFRGGWFRDDDKGAKKQHYITEQPNIRGDALSTRLGETTYMHILFYIIRIFRGVVDDLEKPQHMQVHGE